MCQCSPEALTARSAPRRSVYDQGAAEALEYKWILSERHGYDLGPRAIRLWVRDHWHGFLRQRWLEHLQGETFWIELDHNDFGLLQRQFENTQLLDEVVWRLKNNWENLDVILWALDEGLDMDQVITLLEMLNINGRRLECQFADRLAQAG